MGCTKGIARTLVFVVNFAFLLVGLALLVVGIFFKVNFTKYTDAIPDDYQTLQHVPIFSIVVGSIILVISFLGCCGACKNDTCMLSWYGGILITIFLVQVALGIFAFLQIKNEDDLRNQIYTQIDNIFNRGTSEITDLIQQNFKCCGTTGPSFWATIPATCYPNSDTSSSYYTEGCRTTVADYFIASIKTIAIVAITISAVEVVGAVLALCLTSCIRKERREGAYY